MATYRTPDVYIKEISIFPPSVAEVETAIPCFIGYTEKAKEKDPDDLLNVPTKVTSLLEFSELFGGAPSVTVNEVVLDENNAVSSYDVDNNFYMYDCLRLFFSNGGGKCYIVSIGTWESATISLNKSHFLTGLAALKKKDEPTLILFPDAVLFQDNNLYDIQQQALLQCDNLQDRFAIFDMLESKSSDSTFDWEDGYGEFRDTIGMNYLKYGAAYTPWLKTNLGIELGYRDIKGNVNRSGLSISLKTLTNSSDVETTIDNLDNAVDDVNLIAADLDTVMGSANLLKDAYLALEDTFKNDTSKVNFEALLNFIYNMIAAIDEWADATPTLSGNSDAGTSDIVDDIRNMITNSVESSATTLISYDLGATSVLAGTYDIHLSYGAVDSPEWGGIFTGSTPTLDTSIYVGTDDPSRRQNAQPYISQIFTQVNAAINEIISAAQVYESNFADNLYESHSVYKNIIDNMSGALTTIPPSGAIAGIYAMVDNARGVWKAPANVSLSEVTGLTEDIDFYEQEELNVDTVAGKSINAIRSFTGKGILVWGARTLAGNDNEWRYISVRRFFNMVEESVKKSTYWAVFEPNDANTWVKIKGMIENYLTQKWRDGALAGATPEEAFFVKVGLGLTMTAQDILEGRMNVEIGMAAVRPAEFIILKFSHKMQES